jgi:hypothetical protein
MISKLLANRLQSVALNVVHEKQYGFIKGKTIQDCLGWAFEFLHQCHHSRREIIILKLDFEKAFDLIEHSTVLEMLHAKGFPLKCLRWIEDLLSTATSSVLLNGTARKDFKCTRGVRQGILFPHFYLQLLLISFNVSSTESTVLAISCLLFLKELIIPSQLFSMLMTPSSLCKLMRISCHPKKFIAQHYSLKWTCG